MESEMIAAELETFIRGKFEVAPDDGEFDQDVHLFDYGYVDSFGAVELISFVEEKFGVTVGESDLVVHPLNTIREIADFAVRRQRGEI